MLYALAIALIISIISGDSPFMVPKLDNYVKKHIVDDTRKKNVLVLLKGAKKERKKTVKANGKHFKKFNKYFESRDTKQADFDQLLNEIIETQAKSQKENVKVIKESQGFITAVEWEAIEIDIEKSLAKSDKKRTKKRNKMDKQFLKWANKISKGIADEDKRNKALEEVENLRVVYLRNYKFMQDELLNDKSIMYQYKASETELIALQDEFIEVVKEIFETSFKTHFELAELTTPEEWKKIY
jgi:hypothetical protein